MKYHYTTAFVTLVISFTCFANAQTTYSDKEKSEIAKSCPIGSKLISQSPTVVSCAVVIPNFEPEVWLKFELRSSKDYTNPKVSCYTGTGICIEYRRIMQTGNFQIEEDEKATRIVSDLNSARSVALKSKSKPVSAVVKPQIECSQLEQEENYCGVMIRIAELDGKIAKFSDMKDYYGEKKKAEVERASRFNKIYREGKTPWSVQGCHIVKDSDGGFVLGDEFKTRIKRQRENCK